MYASLFLISLVHLFFAPINQASHNPNLLPKRYSTADKVVYHRMPKIQQ